jgi:hypothetical protein
MSKKNRKEKAIAEDLKKPLSWQFSEHEPKNRHWRWYTIAGAIGLALIVWGMLSDNFMFSLIIILAAFIIYSLDHMEPLAVKVSLQRDGLRVNDRFYPYSKFRSFYIIYKPDLGVKNLYMEFSGASPRFSIPLGKMNPVLVRNHLNKYLEEDLNKIDQPLSEGLAKLLQF